MYLPAVTSFLFALPLQGYWYSEDNAHGLHFVHSPLGTGKGLSGCVAYILGGIVEYPLTTLGSRT